MHEIGGYFELELHHGNEYHENAIQLNTGRNCLELILRVNDYEKIYIPYYTCDAVLEPIQKVNLPYEFYAIDKKLNPIFEKELGKHEVFLYTNYFGLKDNTCKQLSKKIKNLIIDNSQAFYSSPLKDADTFYSPRKFFGVPDGGYLFTNKDFETEFAQDNSMGRVEHLLGRLDSNAVEYYSVFKRNDAALSGEPIKVMSNISQRLLNSVDYFAVAKRRKENFKILHASLKNSNQFEIEFSDTQVPMIYPYLIENGSKLKEKLINYNIFVATYWPNVFDWVSNDSIEHEFASNLIALPIDQRYGRIEMEKILGIILKL